LQAVSRLPDWFGLLNAAKIMSCRGPEAGADRKIARRDF
jgi:hypothetical protein